MSSESTRISFAGAALLSCVMICPANGQDASTLPVPTRHVLFVGDSFTHGRYLPVRTFHNTPGTGGLGSTKASPLVVDENYDTTVAARREDSPGEEGPWGGIAGIFAELAHEAGLPYDVHIEAISATTLSKNYKVAKDVIAQPLWDDVVLQEASFQPIPSRLSQNPKSDPRAFCNAVQTIEEGVHSVAPRAHVYLYSTWAPADTAYLDSEPNGTPSDLTRFLHALGELTDAYREAYASAASHDGHIRNIAPVGDAWARAWSEGIANPDPYGGSFPGVALSFGYQPGSEPKTEDEPTDAGYHHPSRYGAYLNGLVLFETITGVDVRQFRENEKAAEELEIPGDVAVALERVAWETIVDRDRFEGRSNRDPCK